MCQGLNLCMAAMACLVQLRLGKTGINLHQIKCILSGATVFPVLHCHWRFLSVRLQQFTAYSFLSPSPLPHSVRLIAHFILFPSPPSLLFSSLLQGAFDGLMLLSLPSSKERDDCIYQALAYLRDASGTVVLHSQSEQSSPEKKGEKPCVYLTDKQIHSGNQRIPPFIICVLYTVDRYPAFTKVNQALYCRWLQ